MDTRTKLLIAAERLYALYGQEGATSRMIIAEAKQRNASALTYHFSTRDELIEAICSYRMGPINDDRIQRIMEHLSDLPKSAERLRSLVRIACLPSVLPIIEARGKSFFRRFVAQAINNPSTKFGSIIHGKFDAGLQQTTMLICREVSQLPNEVALKRVKTMYHSISFLTAHLEARCAVGAWKERQPELDAELELMIDGFVGFMQAPHTASVPVRAGARDRREMESELQSALL